MSDKIPILYNSGLDDESYNLLLKKNTNENQNKLEVYPSKTSIYQDNTSHISIGNVVYDIQQFQIQNVFLLENKKNMIMDGKFTKIIYSDDMFILYGIFLKVPLLIDGVSTNGISGNKFFFKFQPNHVANENIINNLINIEYRILEFYKNIFKVNKKITTIMRNQLYNGYLKIYKNMSHNKVETDKEWNNEGLNRLDSRLKTLGTEDSSYTHGVEPILLNRPLVSLTETSHSVLHGNVDKYVGSERCAQDSIRNNFPECSEGELAMDLRSSFSVPRLKRREILDNIYPIKKHFLLKISGVWEDSENIGLTYKFEFISVNDLI